MKLLGAFVVWAGIMVVSCYFLSLFITEVGGVVAMCLTLPLLWSKK